MAPPSSDQAIKRRSAARRRPATRRPAVAPAGVGVALARRCSKPSSAAPVGGAGAAVISVAARRGWPCGGQPADVLLSARERKVLALVANGLSDREIAEQLVLSQHTVHRHVANIRHKLGRGSRTAAVAEASRLGLL